MPRIPELPTSRAGRFVKLVYAYARRVYGAVPQPFAVVAHHRPALVTSSVHELMVEKTMTKLPAHVRDLATYRVATRIGCSWCVDFGTMQQRKQGLDIDRLKEIDNYADSPKFTELERLVIEYADAMTDQPMWTTDEQVAALDKRLGHAGMVELTYMIAVENHRSRINHAVGLTAQGFTSGEACKIPQP